MKHEVAERTPDEEKSPTDADLLTRYLTTRDEAAFGELVQRHVNLVYRAALRQLGGDAHRAQEVAQVVFTVLARKASALATHPSLAGWLYTTTHFAVRDLLRGERRRRMRDAEVHMMNQTSTEDSSAPQWERLRPVLDSVMQELAERDRVAILGRFFEGRGFAELGRQCAVSEDAARMRVERALERLRERLARRGVTSTASALGAMLSSESAQAAPAGLSSTVTTAALATAEAGGAVTVGIVQLMSTTKFVATAASLVVLLAVGVAVREWHSRNAAREALAASTADTERLAAQSREVAGQVADAERRLAALEESPPLSTASPAAAPGSGITPSDPAVNGRNFLAQHPEATRLVLEATRGGVRREYLLLFHALGLSPAQIEQFVNVMSEADAGLRWSTAAQVPFAAVDIGAKPSDEEIDARLRAVLGEANFERYLDFRRTRGARNLAEDILRAASFSAPVSAAQAQRLTEILAQQSPAYRAGKNFSLTNFEWDRALNEMRSILGDKQVAVAAAVRERIDAANAVSRAEREARDAAKRAAGFPPNF